MGGRQRPRVPVGAGVAGQVRDCAAPGFRGRGAGGKVVGQPGGLDHPQGHHGGWVGGGGVGVPHTRTHLCIPADT